MSQPACRTIHFIGALSVVGLYCVRSRSAAHLVRFVLIAFVDAGYDIPSQRNITRAFASVATKGR